MVGLGTLINLATVTAGCTVGLLVGSRLPDRIKQVTVAALGLVTCVIGIKMALGTSNLIILLLSVMLGAITGTALGLEDRLKVIGEKLKRAVKSDSAHFVEGYVAASILFCVGPLTVVGSLQDGLEGDFTLLAVKSTLDLFSSMALSAALGYGVAFSLITILVVQGGLTAAGYFLSASFSEAAVLEMAAAGGVLVLAIGLELLDIKKLKPTNYLPALLYAPLLFRLMEYLPLRLPD